MPRICIVGAAGNTHVQRWAAALAAAGYHVSVVSPGPAAASSRALSVPVYSFATASAGMSRAARVAALLRGWARVPGLIAALRPDIVHVHALPTPAAVPFLRLVRPPLVVSAWGSDVVQRDRRKALLYPALLDAAAAVTATSEYLAAVVRGYLWRPRMVTIVPFGVDVDRCVPAQSVPSRRIVGTLRHLEPIYGVDVLLRAAALPGIAHEVDIMIGGTGSQAGALRQLASELGVAERVRWLGQVPHADVAAFMGQLTLFANPSRAESFGVAALEAQACGVPVVATRVGGLPEVVRDGETGLLVPPADPRALADALALLLADEPRRQAMGRAARAWVVARYPWDDSVRRMRAVYDTALAIDGDRSGI